MTDKRSVAIIGSGIGGMAVANILAHAGYRVDVYEKNGMAGGRAGLYEADGFRFDTGPSWYLMPEVFEHYYELVGESVSEQLSLTRLDPAYKVFYEHAAPLTVTSDLERDAETFESVERGAGEQLRRYVDRGELAYQLSLKHFLYTNFQSPLDFLKLDVLRHAPRMMALALTPLHRSVERSVRDRRLQQILEYPMVFLGSSPFKAPALYSLMSALDFKSGVFYPKGGIYSIISSLRDIGEKAGVEYHFDAQVSAITTHKNHATGIALDTGELVTADVVISNADLHHTETSLLPAQKQAYPEHYWRRREAGPSALLLYLGVSGKLPSLEHHNLLFAEAWEENFDAIYGDKRLPDTPSIYVCKPSHGDPSVAPTDHENLFVLVPLPSGMPVPTQKQNRYMKKIIDRLASMLEIPDLKERIVFQKAFGPRDFEREFHAWDATALGPSHILRQSAMFRTRNKSRKLNNLYYVGGSTVPGIGLPMCLIGAELVYKRIIGDRRGGPLPVISTKESDR